MITMKKEKESKKGERFVEEDAILLPLSPLPPLEEEEEEQEAIED